MKKILDNKTLVIGSLVLNIILGVLLVFVKVSDASDLEVTIEKHDNEIVKYEDKISELEDDKMEIMEELHYTRMKTLTEGGKWISEEYKAEVKSNTNKKGVAFKIGG